MQTSTTSDRQPLPATVPAFTGRTTLLRTCLNLVILCLTALGGEWIVHQLEYLVEYRGRFGAVMATTPHRLYMAPVGLALAFLGLTILAIAARHLSVESLRRRQLLHLLPARLNRAMPTVSGTIRPKSFARTGLLLAVLQMAVYAAQENLEALNETASLPGLSVLFGVQHATVIPLHLLVAMAASYLLWALATWLSGSRIALAVVEAIVHLVLTWVSESHQTFALEGDEHVPRRRIAAAARSLRSPPRCA